MNNRFSYKTQVQALLLLWGSALLLWSCGDVGKATETGNYDDLMTQQADSLVIMQTKAGQKKYRFAAPLMETYEYAKEPFRRFPEGIHVISYSDSTGNEQTTLMANYAIERINRELWEAAGNVVVVSAQGHKLETQQLFWDRKTGKIYSNIDSKVTHNNDVIVGVGFESDEEFIDWQFRKPRGKVAVDVDPQQNNSGESDPFAPGGTSGASGTSGSGTGQAHSAGQDAASADAPRNESATSASGGTDRTRPSSGSGRETRPAASGTTDNHSTIEPRPMPTTSVKEMKPMDVQKMEPQKIEKIRPEGIENRQSQRSEERKK